MPNHVAIEVSDTLAERVHELARRTGHTPDELLSEALSRYLELDRLLNALAAQPDATPAETVSILSDFIMEHANRLVHEIRAERAAHQPAPTSTAAGLKAS